MRKCTANCNITNDGPTVVLNVAFDYQIFTRQPYGGISRYYCELAARVNATNGFASKIVAPLHFNEYLAAYAAPKLARYISMSIPRTGRVYRAVDYGLSSWIMNEYRPQIVHRTYYATGRRPQRSKVVLTVFDMIHELYPQHFAKYDGNAVQKKRAVSEADAVLCISQSTANDLQRLLDVPTDKIFVTPLGCSDAFLWRGIIPDFGAVGARPYLLYVGHRANYKNFRRLLDAYSASSRLADDFDLVAFGGPQFTRDERSHIESLKMRPNAVRHESGTDAELARAYAKARALIYPSEYEGFGIPPLEAMSAGCPVICSNVSSMPEVVGSAGEYFDPLASDSIGAAIERVAYDDAKRARMIELGFVQSRTFSWDRCASETIRVYKRFG